MSKVPLEFGVSLDWKRIEGYFELFDMLETASTLRKKYDETKK
jgi:hypothetical protein